MSVDGLTIERRAGDAPMFVLCDHASNAIPPDLNDLGLPEDLLQTHIAWDIGADALAERLADLLGAHLFKCAFSRLVVDVNRAANAPDSIPAASDQVPIAGNQMLSEAARAARIARFHAPYHAALEAALDEACAATAPFFVSVHSFTRRLLGAAEDRPWPIGLLWREDEKSARIVIERLARAAGWPIGDNEPYDARVFNYSVDRHIGPRGLAHITVEVRQDMLADARGVAEIAALLADAVEAAAQAARAVSEEEARP